MKKRSNSFILYHLIIIQLFLFFSCRSIDSNDNDKESVFRNDSTLVKEFYDDGKIKSEKTIYNENKRREIWYFSNGEKKYDGFYYDKLQDSVWYWYNKEGDILAIDYWKLGKPYGGQVKFEYNQPKEFLFYSLDNLIFHIKYEKPHLNIEGSPMFVYYNKRRLKMNEVFDISTLVATPPSININTKFLISYENKEFEDVSHEVSITKRPYGKVFSFSKKMKESGEYVWNSISYVESNNSTLKTDTMEVKIIVEKKIE